MRMIEYILIESTHLIMEFLLPVNEGRMTNYPRVGVGDGHLYNTTSPQCSVMTEDYCAAPLRSSTVQLHCAAPLRSSTAQLKLRSSNCAVWLKMTRHFGACARNYILKINADVYISGFETFAPSAENV